MVKYCMGTIAVLPEHLRNKIAAGEVVERPASVVKELVENAIDAGSTRISVDITRAGRGMIKVADNGAGMDREDALLAFERYATSKIRSEDDLFALATMGFRGEALSSIASVSRMRLVTGTRRSADGAGVCIESAGGELGAMRDCPASGATVEVKDLFFNTPARRKFLKSDTTERFHIIDTVTRAAIAHHTVGFILRMEGSEVLQLPAASSLRERLLQIFGKELLDSLAEAERLHEQVRVRAFVSAPAALKSNKSSQYLFVNRRPIKDQAVTSAVYRAYGEAIPKEKHPAFFLFLEVDPAVVDFNVHPAKREVRFENKSGIFNVVYQTVRAAIGIGKAGERIPMQREDCSNGTATGDIAGAGRPAYRQEPIEASPPASAQSVSEEPSFYVADAAPLPSFLYLGDTLVALAGREGLTVVDYHAAHERVNYERFLKRMAGHSLPLLFPRQVALQSGECRVVLEHRELLRELGLDLDDFGRNTIIVRSLPEVLRDADLDALIGDIAAALIEKEPGSLSGEKGEDIDPLDAVRKTLAARLACHTSIRGKEAPDGARLARLLQDLDAADNPHTCPHGRPTRVVISSAELRRMFRK